MCYVNKKTYFSFKLNIAVFPNFGNRMPIFKEFVKLCKVQEQEQLTR